MCPTFFGFSCEMLPENWTDDKIQREGGA